MTLYGKTSTNMGTGVITFDSTGANAERYALDVLEEIDQGTYRCLDNQGREWILVDYEDEAKLILD